MVCQITLALLLVLFFLFRSFKCLYCPMSTSQHFKQWSATVFLFRMPLLNNQLAFPHLFLDTYPHLMHPWNTKYLSSFHFTTSEKSLKLNLSTWFPSSSVQNRVVSYFFYSAKLKMLFSGYLQFVEAIVVFVTHAIT